jgi:hypothetical protein
MPASWDEQNQPEPMRFLAFANAYLQASIEVCTRMNLSPEENTWPNANVVLFLKAHATELFLKGALSIRQPKRLEGAHDLEALADQYRNEFSDSSMQFEIPFQSLWLTDAGGIPKPPRPERSGLPEPSIQYRYPVSSPGVEWPNIVQFDSTSELESLRALASEFARLQSLLDRA